MKKLVPTNKVADVVDTVTDYVENGDLHKDAIIKNVMVESESDLANLTNYGIGTIAYTAGFQKVWQKDADGTWQAMD